MLIYIGIGYFLFFEDLFWSLRGIIISKIRNVIVLFSSNQIVKSVDRQIDVCMYNVMCDGL